MSKSTESVNTGFGTKAIRAGQEYEQWSNLEIVLPIVTSMTYYQNDPTHMKDHLYSRLSNPTRDVLQRCLAALDNGKHCLAYPSGVSATSAILHLLKAGDHILSCSEQYGGTRLLLLDYTKNQGIEIDFVDSTNTKLVENSIKPNTKLIWVETPSNPCMKITDIAAIANLAHKRTENPIIFAVDNTFLTSYFQRPLDLGVDIVMYSLSKYMNGHNDVLGGALIVNDSGIYEQLNYHQTHYGSVLSPFDCYLVNRSLKTLPLRMEKHQENGLAVARYLEKHPEVVHVCHPGLYSHPHFELNKKQSSGHCGMVTFQMKGTMDDAKNFVLNLKVFMSSGSLGSCSSFAMIPTCVSHKSMPKKEKERLGIYDTTVRLSVGLENIEDLIRDLEQAFKKTFK